MDSSDRILGSLEEFKKSSEKRLDSIEVKIDSLREFKAQTIVSARWVSLIVSSVCGLLTMLVTAYVTSKFK